MNRNSKKPAAKGIKRINPQAKLKPRGPLQKPQKGGGGCCGCKKKKNAGTASNMSKTSKTGTFGGLFKKNAPRTGINSQQKKIATPNIVPPVKRVPSTVVPTTIPITKAAGFQVPMISDKSGSARKKRAIKTPPNKTSGTQQSPENSPAKKSVSEKEKAASPKKAEEDASKAAPAAGIKEKKTRPSSHVAAIENQKQFQEVKIVTADAGNGMTERKVLVTSIYLLGKPPKMAIGSGSGRPERQVRASNNNSCYSGSSNNLVATTPSNYTTLDKANSTEKLPPVNLSSELMISSPVSSVKQQNPANKQSTSSKTRKIKDPAKPCTQKASETVRDRALATINKLRSHYQLTHDEIRVLSKNPDLKVITIRAGLALQEAQRNLRNLKVLAGSQMLPDLALFNDELNAVILELDRFMDAMQTVSEHAEQSPVNRD